MASEEQGKGPPDNGTSPPGTTNSGSATIVNDELNTTLSNINEKKAIWITQSNPIKSALENPQIVSLNFRKCLKLVGFAGPFTCPPFKNFRCLPVRIIPKKVPSEFHMIQHLSYPKDSSVNDSIPQESSSVHYATISDAIRVIKCFGSGCFMAKTGIKSAFRIIPIHPADFELLGMKWDNFYYYDKALLNGCSTSCSIFESYHCFGIDSHNQAVGICIFTMIFYFLLQPKSVVPMTYPAFLGLCKYRKKQKKRMGLLSTLQFTGITLDFLNMEARLPVDKLQKCHNLLSEFLHKRSITLHDLQSLIGPLNLTCSVIVPGHTFLRCLIDLTTGIRCPTHHKFILYV